MNREEAFKEMCCKTQHEWRQKFHYNRIDKRFESKGYYCIHCLLEIDE